MTEIGLLKLRFFSPRSLVTAEQKRKTVVGESVLKSLSLLREKSVLLWANSEGRKCGGMDGLWREGGGPQGDQGTCLFIRLYRKW